VATGEHAVVVIFFFFSSGSHSVEGSLFTII
jgi:hypothetical protein